MRTETIGDCTLYLGDCLEIMPTLDPVDAVVTDPPYFKVKGESWDRQWDKPEIFLWWMSDVLALCSQKMEDHASIFVFTSPEMNFGVEAVVRQHFKVLNNVRWQKEQGWHQKQKKEEMRRFQTPWEGIIFAEKNGSDDAALEQSGYELACDKLHRRVYAPLGNYFKSERQRRGLNYRDIADYISRDTALYLRWEEGNSLPNPDDYAKCRQLFNMHHGEFLTREYDDLRREHDDLRAQYEHLRRDYEYLRRDYEYLRRPFFISDEVNSRDIWKFSTISGYENKHPCEKPVAVMNQILLPTTRRDQVILDPFMGSGTTGVACVKLGRKFIGIELEEKYFDIAVKRIEEAYRQPDLFIEPPAEAEQLSMEITTK